MKKLACLALWLAFGSLAQAAPITFIHTGFGTGTLGGVAFGTSEFTITSAGDTNNRVNLGFGFFIDHVTSTISIDGIGVLTFTTGTRTFVNNGGSIVGFSRAGIGGLDLYNGPNDAQFGIWDMLSSIGPVAGSIGLLQWGNSAVNTSGGVLFFDSAPSRGFFQAIVGQQVPEPGTLTLAALALVALSMVRRRRQNG